MSLALLFPGQGSQFVGMGKSLCEGSPAARKVFDEADAVLGFPLSRICFEGPEEELRRTAVTQPAILTTAVPVGLEHQAYHLFTVTAHTDGTQLGVPAKVLEMPAPVAAFRPFGPAGALNLAERRFPPLFTPPVRTIAESR